MTPRYYHTPPSQNSTRVRCPVCHETVYSKAGIHPQCAVRQSERPDPKDKGAIVPKIIEPIIQAIEEIGGIGLLAKPVSDDNHRVDGIAIAPLTVIPIVPDLIALTTLAPRHRVVRNESAK